MPIGVPTGPAIGPSAESGGETEVELWGEHAVHPAGWIKRVLPRTMFGRSLLIVVMPLILLQAIATWIFYDRHWAAISWRLSTGVAGDIALTIEAIELTRSAAATELLLERGGALTDLGFTLERGAHLPPPRRRG